MALKLLEGGVKIDEGLKTILLEFIPKDAWSKESEERKYYVDELYEGLKN